jgi:hypothetical protein
MGQQLNRIVCAANLVNDTIICGVRHYDPIMRAAMAHIQEAYSSANVVQGFVDKNGKFHTREAAWEIAESAGQVRWHPAVKFGMLFSEDLY